MANQDKKIGGLDETRYNKCVATVLANYASNHKYKQAQIAEYLGVSQPMVSRIEKGDVGLSVWRLRQLLALYQVDYYTFFSRVEAAFMSGFGAEEQ